MIHLGKVEVAAGEHDFRWKADYTEVDVVPLRWHDNASYARYQSDSGE